MILSDEIEPSDGILKPTPVSFLRAIARFCFTASATACPAVSYPDVSDSLPVDTEISLLGTWILTGGLTTGSFFFLNKKSAMDWELIPESFDISLNRVLTLLLSSVGFISLRAGGGGLAGIINLLRLLPSDTRLGGGDVMIGIGGALGLGMTTGLSSGITGLIGTMISTGFSMGAVIASSPTTLTDSFANTGNSTGAELLMGVPKLGGVGVGLKPPVDWIGL